MRVERAYLKYVYGSEALLKIRIAASIALAAGLALGASGCSLIAHQATAEHYAPSDGIEITADGVALRNILLVEDESGENFNLVFTGVNKTESPAIVELEFSAEGGQDSLSFELPVGTTTYGDPEAGQETLVISIPNLAGGASVETYFTINGFGDHNGFVPVVDGTLREYAHLVLSASDVAPEEDATDEDATDEAADEPVADGPEEGAEEEEAA